MRTEMEYGDTVIIVLDMKVDEMIRKGWKVKEQIEAVDVSSITEENLEAEQSGDS